MTLEELQAQKATLQTQLTTQQATATAAATEFASATSALTTLQAQVTAAQTTVNTASSKVTDAKAVVASTTAQIAAVQKQIDDWVVTPPPPPPPPTGKRKMYVGSSVQASGVTQAQAIQQLESKLGERLGARREYDGDGVDVNWIKAAAALDAGRARVYSHKGQASQLTQAMYDALPQDGFPTYWAWYHEPEDLTGATFRAGAEAWITKINGFNSVSKRTDVIPGVIYTGYWERDNSASTSTEDWIPKVPLANVFMGIDSYDPNAKKTLKQQYQGTLDLWKKHGGVRWGITETGTHRTSDADRANWITEGFKAVYTDGGEVITWFNSDIGSHAASGWFIEGTKTIAAFNSFMPFYQG